MSFYFFGRGRGEFRFRMFLAIDQSKWPIAPPRKKKEKALMKMKIATTFCWCLIILKWTKNGKSKSIF
jgi:hypothetical protein